MTTSVRPNSATSSERKPPIMGSWPLGVLPAFRRDPLALYTQARDLGDLVQMRFGPRTSWTLFHPDYVQHVLVNNQKNYVRSAIGAQLLKMFTGENLLTGEGDFWRSQRRLMQPGFHRRRIAGFAETMTQAADEMLARWDDHPQDQLLDVDQQMMKVTLRVVGEALFSVDLTDDASVLGPSITASSEYIAANLGRLIRLPLWVPTPANLRLKRATEKAAHVVPDLIRERRQLIAEEGSAEEASRSYDFLDMLLDARYEETGEGMDDAQVEREANIIITAGHETTANALTWALYLLSQHPDEEAKLHAELDRVLNGRVPTLEDLPNLPQNRMVLEETLRLYPPAWILARQTIGPDEIGGQTIEPETPVIMPVYAIHRHPALWENPDRFDPERFTPERSEGRHRHAYMPFGMGPRLCIGRDFALMEAQLILAMIAQRYQLRTPPGYQATPEPLITLRVKDGLPMTLTPRFHSPPSQ